MVHGHVDASIKGLHPPPENSLGTKMGMEKNPIFSQVNIKIPSKMYGGWFRFYIFLYRNAPFLQPGHVEKDPHGALPLSLSRH